MLALLIRLILLLAVTGLAVYGIRRWLRAAALRPPAVPEPLPPGELDARELSRLEVLARSSQGLSEALSLRHKIFEAVPGRFAPEVDAVLRHLSKQAETIQRIEAAIAELDTGLLAEEIDATETRRLHAESEEAKRLAEGTLERLVALRDSLDKLKRRREELEIAMHHIVLELRGIHLSVLEAASSAGLGDEASSEIRRKLASASEELKRRAAAEEEVAKLLASAGAKKEATRS